jgi:hypothetical protein
MGWSWNWPINDFALVEDRMMEIRKPIYTATGNIDCEIEHPHFGWIPFTASPDDAEEHGRVIYAAALEMDPAPYVAAPPAPIDPKLIGVEFDGIMCSATAQDQNGLAAVMLAIQLQGEAFQPTRFEFDNGSTLILTLANWQAFAAVWLPFRQSFFAVES